MKECIAIILVMLIAAWFWVAWWQGMQTYITEKNTITALLETRGLTQVKVFPKSVGCYTYNALKDDYKIVTGKVCLDDSDD